MVFISTGMVDFVWKNRRIKWDFQILEDTNNYVKGAFYQIAKQPPI
jgi:hypothetical protein